MHRSRALAVVALGALLLLAGCQAPGTPQGPDFASDITVVNATGADQGTTIPVANNGTVDPGHVYAQVQQLLGTDAEPPERVTVVDEGDELSTNASTVQSPIRRHLNVTDRADLELGDRVGGGVTAFGGIIIYPGQERDPQEVGWVLAHELVHYLQVRTGQMETLRNRIAMSTTDGRFTRRAMAEGPAVFATEAYLDEYGAENETTLTLYDTIDEGMAPGSAGKYGNRQYLLGYSYVREQIDSASELDELYENSALSSEHLIHGYDPQAEPILDLNVSYDGGEGWSVTGRDRMGEAFIWTAIEDRLGTDRARTAAAGWGNDSLLTVYPTDEGNASFAWTMRWDDAANASQFADAMGTYLDRADTARDNASVPEGLHRLETGAYARFERVDDRTTLVLIGDRPFVAGTTAEADGAEVRLATGDE